MTVAATAVPTVARQPGRLLIDGQWVEAHDGRTIDVENPATGEVLTTVARASALEVDRAVAAARRAFEGWRSMDASQRERILLRIADLIEENKDELALVESLQNGKTVKEAHRGDIPPSWDVFRYYAGWCRKIHGETIPVDGPYLNYTMREPMGVVGAIVAWNYPMLLASWKLAPALATGNTVVLKPSAMTPLTALRLGEICLEAGVPAGVVNVVTGTGEEAGLHLARHMDVDKLAFTGSVEVARELLRASGDSNLKRLSLELGGKSPQIVFPDADLDLAAEAAWKGIFANKGEICSAGSRLLLHRDVYDEVVSRVIAKAQSMKVGDPLDPSTDMGAVASRAQLERVERYVAQGVAEGARLRCGGQRVGEGPGYYYPPTVFDQVTPSMVIAREEIFGPVLVCLSFETEEEAVALANGTAYGLVSAVWTRDMARAHRMARRIRAGSVWLNLWNGFDSASPFGGYGLSGYGREMGIHAMESYTQIKSVWVATDR